VGGLTERFPQYPGIRSAVVVDLGRVADSCSYGVPLYEYAGERPQLPDWAEGQGEEGLRQYKATKNRESIDGLPGLRCSQGSGD
jgi:hypothetical protein